MKTNMMKNHPNNTNKTTNNSPNFTTTTRSSSMGDFRMISDDDLNFENRLNSVSEDKKLVSCDIIHHNRSLIRGEMMVVRMNGVTKDN